MSQLRPEMTVAVRDLIAHLTGFDEDEENFALCLDFAASNLLYHNFFDPEERSVFKWMDGLREKLLVHAEREKAKDLEELVDEYRKAEVFKERHEQHDVHIRILSLLQHLSEGALKAKWEGREEKEKVEKHEEKVDWKKLLAEGEEEWRPGSEEELSEWSEEEGEEEDDDGKEDKKEVEVKPPPLLSPIVTAIGPGRKDPKDEGDPQEIVSRLVQPQYWKSSRCDPLVESPFPSTARFSSRVDALLRAGGVNTVSKVTLSEYQLLRECVWSLRNPSPSTVFDLVERGRGKGFFMRENVCLPSVTSGTLCRSAGSICRLMDHLRALLDFCLRVFAEQKNFDSTIPFTYEAYASALNEILQMFSSRLLKLEKTVSDQEETFTLLDLFAGLQDWPKVIAKLFHCHVSLVGRSEEKGHSNWQKSVVLLSGLHEQIIASHDRPVFDVFVNLYLKTTFPYLRIAGLWLSEGRLEDYRSEFPFSHRTDDREGEDFWTEGMVVRDYASFLEGEGLRLPEMLEETLPSVLVSGKSMEILTILRKNRVITPSNANFELFSRISAKDLLQTFLDAARHNLSKSADATDAPPSGEAAEKNVRPRVLRNDSCLDPSNLDMDPYLALAFAEVCSASQRDETDSSEDEDADSFYLLKGVDPFQPVPMILSRCLSGLVSENYRAACDSLSHLILKTLDLQHHLGSVRKVFLMEAGDLLFEFYSDLFRRLETGLDLESTSITFFLQDCVARRYHEEADRFSVTLPEREGEELDAEQYLDGMVLSYSVDWPLNIILSSKSLAVYNKVFRFLLRVKRAMWSLRQIQAKELISQLVKEEEKQEEEKQEDKLEDEEERLSPSLRIHRVLLLRSWLLHFVGNVHSYFMSRVLHTTELELRAALRDCADLDQILRAHGEYLARVFDRCFLHSSARVLREAVFRVLGVCHRLAGLCGGGGGSDGTEYI